MLSVKKGPYSYDDLVKILRDLRGEDGCPWDRVQTLESLRPCMLEEAAEYVGAYRIYQETGDAENLKEELGDLMLQVIMNSQIAEDAGLFSLEDVINGISEKMIRRHPHVFSTGEADNPEQVLAVWDEIKKKEKEGKAWVDTPLREIPRELPALTRAEKVQKKVDKLYQKAPSLEERLCQMEQDIRQLRETSSSEEMKSIVGHLLRCITDLGWKYKLSEEQLLIDQIDDIITKYEPMGNQ